MTNDLNAKRRLDCPIHTERHVRIICIGAGASGLLMAYKLQRNFQNYSLQIYEKNPKLGGTWYENVYPGCACDVPSHNYTWSFEPKLDWSSVYPPRHEIFEYFDGFANKYNLKKYINTEHHVEGAYWYDGPDRSGYKLKVRDLATGSLINDDCDILINASGILNNWKWPDIPGLDRYTGTLLHSARWDESVSLEGKRVGLVGNGSSGIQILPAIREQCKKVTCFIRNPTWVSPISLKQHTYTPDERNDFINTPGKLTAYRKTIECGLGAEFAIFLRDSDFSKATKAHITQQMKKKLQDEGLASRLIPEWSVGCRRLTPGTGYLESLTKPNVEVVHGGIVEITERGCVSEDGREHAFEVLICATGFDTSFRPRFPIVGPSGVNLQDKWAQDPQSYLGVAAAGFPNYFTIIGPNSPVGNGPVLAAVESQADWMCKLIDRYQTTNMRSFAPTEEAVRDFIGHKDRFMVKTVWTDQCKSWYQSSDGERRIFALWPGSTMHYIECLRQLRLEDFDVKYAGNRFAWLGNGFSGTELDKTCDMAYYIREQDDDPPLSTAGYRKLVSKSGTVTQQDGWSWSGGRHKKKMKSAETKGDVAGDGSKGGARLEKL